MVNLSFFDQFTSGLHHTGNSHQSRGPSAIRLISWGAHQTMSTASKYKLQFQIWTSRSSFFHIWLASIEFRREKNSSWHVASSFLKNLKFSVKSKFEISRNFFACLFYYTSPSEQAFLPSHQVRRPRSEKMMKSKL